jgi:hypothetical protein
MRHRRKTSRHPRRDVFRSTAGLRLVIVIVTTMFVAGLAFSYFTSRTVLFYSFLGLTALGVLGIVETLVSRVELHDDHITAVALFRRRIYARGDVTSVTWSKGAPVSIQLNGSTWVHLPNTGHSSARVVGAIRAWLNEDSVPKRLPRA